VLNNPLKFTDPTGHCAEGDGDDQAACRAAQLTLAQHGIGLEAGILSPWKLNELKLVIEAIIDLRRAANWSVSDFVQAMDTDSLSPTKIWLTRGGANSTYAAYTAGMSITLYDGAFTAGALFTKRTVVHELGHLWDEASRLSLSSGLTAATGGHQSGCVEFDIFGGCFGTYNPGDSSALPSPNSYFSQNKYEDFAESVAATVYGSAVANYKGSKRDLYVRGQLSKYSTVYGPPPPPP
jgi:hypothetical protein